MILSEKDIITLTKCSAGLISNEDLLLEMNYKVDYDGFIALLDNAYKNKNQSLFEAILWCMPNNLKHFELEKLYSRYVVLKNHNQHENIARQFQLYFNTNPKNINTLLKAIDEQPDYLSPDDFKYPYIRKLVYAIGAQPEPYNIEALEKLANETTDQQIKDLAQHQIKKRKELGRWEAAKNAQ